MKKRLFALLCVLCLLAPAAVSAQEDANFRITLRPGQTYTFPEEVDAAWESDDPDTVSALGNVFTAENCGFARLTALDENGRLWSMDITVTEESAEEEIPVLIRDAIGLALDEWEQNGGKTLERSNKYTKWYNGNNAKYGWCAAFECYCLYHAGIPMVVWTECEPHEDGAPWSVRANGVGKVIEGFNKMNRLTFTPRTGYLLVYGQADSGTCMHVGLITRCEELGEGRYLIETVEGNMSNRVKRYCFEYNINGADESRANGKNNYTYIVKKNYDSPPAEYQTDPDTFQYTKQVKNWYVYRFCATWF